MLGHLIVITIGLIAICYGVYLLNRKQKHQKH